MGTNYAPLVADLFLFCYERDFMTSLSDEIMPILLRHLAQLLDTRVIQEVMRTHPLFLSHLVFLKMVYMYIMIYYRFFEI